MADATVNPQRGILRWAALGLAALLPLSAMLAAQDAPPASLPPDQAAIKAHVMFLASDAMKGREAGSG